MKFCVSTGVGTWIGRTDQLLSPIRIPEPKNLKVEDLSKSVKQVPHSGHEMHRREMLFTPRGSQHGKERYFYQLLKVFRPRRDEQNIYSPEQTYEAAFVEKSEHLPAIVEYDRKNCERIAHGNVNNVNQKTMLLMHRLTILWHSIRRPCFTCCSN